MFVESSSLKSRAHFANDHLQQEARLTILSRKLAALGRNHLPYNHDKGLKSVELSGKRKDEVPAASKERSRTSYSCSNSWGVACCFAAD
jgi:hypothetical protein